MKVLKVIFRFIWAIWGAFWFMLVVSIFTILYAFIFSFSGKKYAMHCVWINCHYLCPFLMKVCGIQMRVFGKGKIQAHQTYVFVANHRAQVDIITSASALPQPVKFLAKAEIKYIPFFGFMTKMLAIMVNRQSRESREKSYRYMVTALQRGESLFIYPEGTRNRTNLPLKEFKDGAFKVAIIAQVPIAVQTLVGTREVNEPRGIQLSPGKVEVHWSQPIETKGMTLNDLPILKEMVRKEMLQYL